MSPPSTISWQAAAPTSTNPERSRTFSNSSKKSQESIKRGRPDFNESDQDEYDDIPSIFDCLDEVTSRGKHSMTTKRHDKWIHEIALALINLKDQQKKKDKTISELTKSNMEKSK